MAEAVQAAAQFSRDPVSREALLAMRRRLVAQLTEAAETEAERELVRIELENVRYLLEGW